MWLVSIVKIGGKGGEDILLFILCLCLYKIFISIIYILIYILLSHMLTSPCASSHLALLKNEVMASMVTWPPLPATLPLPLLLPFGALPDTVTASARLLLPTILLLPNPGRAGSCGEYKL